MRKRILTIIGLLMMLTAVEAQVKQTLDEAFRHPSDECKPIMIWQWMDGLISEEGITADLEAYAEAGIGGVQQFLVGGPDQVLVKDTTKAIGTDEWKRLMRHAIRECGRLGLSFGTHNCPGWSSSAYPSVRPEYSMQKLVWNLDTLPDFYREIAVVAVPDADTVRLEDIIVLTPQMKLPQGSWRVFRFGHTTNGKTNEGTAPWGGVGLEIDKMSREALDHYWQGYPQMLFDLVPESLGKTFKRLEIDSYEAGGQEWSTLLPNEFLKRRGYDIIPWLPAIAGITIESKQRTQQFKKDWQQTVSELFAENYYGYMSQLVHRHRGMTLLVQPYGTGSSRPFNPINTDLITRHVAKNDLICAEFWAKPDNWGWKDVPRVANAARKYRHERVWAEGFTCWPLHAWRDTPDDLKATADRAFCLGINNLMLHAAAHNPWVGREPGMTFGYWGTWWTPGQTWWKNGAARQLFTYMARCQALLQRGRYVDDYHSKNGSLVVDGDSIQWIRRQDGDADIYFVANTKQIEQQIMLTFQHRNRMPEIFHPEHATIEAAKSWLQADEQTQVSLSLNPREALFVVFRHHTDETGPGLELPAAKPMAEALELTGPWTVFFPDMEPMTMSELTPWNESDIPEVKYFSGTARYRIYVKNKKKRKPGQTYLLDLGEVRDMAKVYVDGQLCADLWRPPFRVDLSEVLDKGGHFIEIEVTNLWINRMIGDKQEPDDVEWSEPFHFGAATGQPAVGRFMTRVPDWLKEQQPRPSQGRKAVVSFKFYEKDAPLVRSGLIGPVKII